VFTNDITLTNIVSDNMSIAEAVAYNWAVHEAYDNNQFINDETNSVLEKDNARVNVVMGQQVKRLFATIVDIFAIINYTEDSFSDGGKYNTLDMVLERIHTHLDQGARIIDFGVESTRPNAKTQTSIEEITVLKSVLPEVIKLKQTHKFELSIDSYHDDTVRWLLDQDVDLINDVSGNLPLELVGELLSTNRKYVAMHSITIPADKGKIIALDKNPVTVIHEWMVGKIAQIGELGYGIDGLILDPGIGFGKNAAQSWHIIRHLELLRDLPCEILLGHSRKSMFRQISDQPWEDLDLETAVVALQVLPNVDYLRLHDLTYLNQIIGIF